VTAFKEVIIPALHRYQPELIVVASGLDASAMDPMGRMLCTSHTYRVLAELVVAASDQLCQGRLVATHEGGYSNAYVPFCGLAVLEAMSGIKTPVVDPYLDELSHMAGHELLPHQEHVIRAAQSLLAHIPTPQ